MTVDEITYAEIVDRLNGMADRVAETCIPNGRREGIYWRGDLHGKVSVHVRGGRVGTVGYWQGQHVANDKGGGNLVSLIELAFQCPSHGAAVRIAKERFLGIGRRELTADEKRRFAQQQEESKRRAAQRQRDDERERAQKVETVQSIWREAVPIASTPAEAYLRSRAIELSDFPPGTRWMPSLRYHTGLPHGGRRHPALIGGVQAADRKLTALWRIFLQPDGSPLVDQEGKKVKLGFGPAAGGAVRLGPAGPMLRVAEGIETSLGVMLLTRCRVPVWATLSTSGMVNFQIPAGVKRLEIYADNDRTRANERNGALLESPGMRAARQLMERAKKEGVEAVVCPSVEPDDWLNTWQARKRDDQQQRYAKYLD